jgi:putative transposase
VADFTYVRTWSGTVYVAFVADVSSRAIVGWPAATSKRAKLVLDTLEMALGRRDRAGTPSGPGLVHHSDAGSTRLSLLDELGSRSELDWTRCAIDSVNMRALKRGI